MPGDTQSDELEPANWRMKNTAGIWPRLLLLWWKTGKGKSGWEPDRWLCATAAGRALCGWSSVQLAGGNIDGASTGLGCSESIIQVDVLSRNNSGCSGTALGWLQLHYFPQYKVSQAASYGCNFSLPRNFYHHGLNHGFLKSWGKEHPLALQSGDRGDALCS